METLEVIEGNSVIIKIPDTVTSIKERLFCGCYQLEHIECDSDYFKSIDGVLFSADYKTLVCYPPSKRGDSYVIPESVVNIGQRAFENCRSLENIILPNSLINIGWGAFISCSSLRKIILPNSLTNIEAALFVNCLNLESIECNNNYLKSIDGVLFSASYKTLICYAPKKEGASYIIPTSVLDIDNRAFSDCKSLENITFPDSLIDIGSYAFSGCNLLENIILPNSLIRIGEGAFGHCKSLQNIELPNSLTKIEKSAFVCCASLRKIELPDSVLEIGNYIFADCRRLRKVVLSLSLTCIPEGAFCDCCKLKEITLPESIKNIKERAFYYCESLQGIKLPKNIVSVNPWTFYRCKLLQHIELPNSIQCIEDSAFASCESLQEIKLPENIVNINSRAFCGCQSLEKIKLPTSIQVVGHEVFLWCKSLEMIECDNEHYQAIDGVLFDRKEKRCICYPNGKMGRKYVIPEDILIIGKAAFNGCRELEEIILPDSITTIENEAFGGCLKLKQIKIPNQVNTIEPHAFNNCCSLKFECNNSFFKSIDGVLFTADCKTLICYPEGKGREHYAIPDSVSNIAKGAFYGISSYFSSTSCEGITLSNSMVKITSADFKDHENLKRIECDSDYYKSIDGVLFTADCKTLVCYPRGRQDVRYIIPDSVVDIEKDAFEGCYSLGEINIPKGSLDKFKRMLPEDMWDKFKEL